MHLVDSFIFLIGVELHWGFPGGSAGKESTCNAGDPGLLLGWGRSPGEEIGCPLQHSWASLVAQLKESACNAADLGWEDPLEGEMATHSSTLVWRIPLDRGAWQATVHGVTKGWTRLSKISTAQLSVYIYIYIYIYILSILI